MPNTDDDRDMLLAMYMALAAGLELDSQERQRGRNAGLPSADGRLLQRRGQREIVHEKH